MQVPRHLCINQTWADVESAFIISPAASGFVLWNAIHVSTAICNKQDTTFTGLPELKARYLTSYKQCIVVWRKQSSCCKHCRNMQNLYHDSYISPRKASIARQLSMLTCHATKLTLERPYQECDLSTALCVSTKYVPVSAADLWTQSCTIYATCFCSSKSNWPKSAVLLTLLADISQQIHANCESRPSKGSNPAREPTDNIAKF